MGASTPKHFKSEILDVGPFEADWPETAVKGEPMFFNAHPEWAAANGGPITKAFVLALPASYRMYGVLDTRVHMLMPGWYPAIPGFHHDDVPRPPIPTGQHFITAGQPDYDNPRYKSQHIMGLVNADLCPTLFALGKCTMPAIPEGGLIYRAWHQEVQKLLADGRLSPWECPNGRLIWFDWQSFHTGQKCRKGGWRWFGRVSLFTDRTRKITNEIRQQVQVYLEFPMEGW